jgi:hypothetical protein|tara:strand:+ start:417 stop:569 length:153 start_codon:yes stop_codon:yes gene_type:complete
MLGSSPNKKVVKKVRVAEVKPSQLDRLKEELRTMDSVKLSTTLQKDYNAR